MNKKIDELVRDYLTLRDKKEAVKREFTEQTAQITEVMDQMEAEFLRYLQETGVETVSTKLGTVYTSETTRTKVVDWNVLVGYVKENDAYDLLTKNVSKEAVLKRIEDEGIVVPGIDIVRFRNVGIRRK